jgi:uncharacterized protein with HEPN domain
VTTDALRMQEYLDHIGEAIRRIRRYTADMTEASFAQDAVIRNIEIIGETSRNIARHYPEFAAR